VLIRAVIDTNVFVSSLLNPGGAPGTLVRQFRAGRFQLVVSTRQREELVDVFNREHLFDKYQVSRQERDDLLGLVDALAEFVTASPSVELPVRDPKDVMVLQAALAGTAD
jgi:putative PIN family toxin of toxin-antitoxin system